MENLKLALWQVLLLFYLIMALLIVLALSPIYLLWFTGKIKIFPTEREKVIKYVDGE